MSNSDKARLKRITAAVLADQPPAPDDFAWLEAKRDESWGYLLAAKEVMEKKGADGIRMLLHPDTLTSGRVDKDGRLVISLNAGQQPNQLMREVGYDSLELATTNVALAHRQGKGSKAATVNRKAGQAEKVQTLCDIIDDPANASLGWTDMMDQWTDMMAKKTGKEKFVLPKQLEERMTRYKKARGLHATKETALWASEEGNWRKFQKVLRSLKS